MEPLITASIGLGLFNEQFYLQVITPRDEIHYWIKIPRKVAYSIHAKEQLEIIELNATPQLIA